MADKLTDDDALVDAIAEVIASFFGEHDSPADAARAILPLIAAREATARAEGYAAGREDAAKLVDALSNDYFLAWREGHKGSSYLEGQSDGTDVAAAAIRNMGGEHGAD